MRRFMPFAPAAIFALGCALLWKAHSQAAVPLTGELSAVLDSMPGYTMHDQVLSADEQRVAGMSKYVARAYARDSTIVFTTLVSYYERQTQGKTIHSPRNCLPGAGWEIVSGGSHEVTTAGNKYVVNRYVLKNGPATAVAYYWYQGRGRVVANEYAVKWNLLRDAALRGRTEEALVRLVIPVNANRLGAAADLKAADAAAAPLAARLVTEVNAVLPSGQSGT